MFGHVCIPKQRDFLLEPSPGARLALETIKSFHVVAYVEDKLTRLSKLTVKRRLAAVRMLFDWLVVGQVVPLNPAAAVRGQKHFVNAVTPRFRMKNPLKRCLQQSTPLML